MRTPESPYGSGYGSSRRRQSARHRETRPSLERGASLGSTLRRARVSLGATHSEAAAATRIKVQTIEALENDDFSKIAAPIYGKGFIKLYAEYLGLDPAPLIEEYVAQVEGGSHHRDDHDYMFEMQNGGDVVGTRLRDASPTSSPFEMWEWGIVHGLRASRLASAVKDAFVQEPLKSALIALGVLVVLTFMVSAVCRGCQKDANPEGAAEPVTAPDTPSTAVEKDAEPSD